MPIPHQDETSTLRLEMLGGLGIHGAQAGAAGHQRRRLALLALLSLAGPRGLSRDQLVAYLWPEKNAADARHSLEQLLYGIRRSLGEETFTGTNPIALNGSLVASDVAEFEAAIAAGALERAIGLYRGSFLAGFFLSDAPAFERWVESERARLGSLQQGALEQLVERALVGNVSAAPRLASRLAEIDPLSARFALLLMRAFDAAGDRSAALRHARIYETLVREELNADVDPSITTFAEQIRRAPPQVAPQTPPPATRTNRSNPIRTAARAKTWHYAAAVVLGVLVAVLAGVPDSQPAKRAVSRSSPVATKSVAAVQLYRLGQQQWNYRTDSSLRRSVSYFEQAIDKDPNFAAAHAGVAAAYAYLGTGNYSDFSPREAGGRAKAAALRAITIDDSLADAHAVLGFVRMLYDYDFAGAEAELKRALELDPMNRPAHQFTSIFLDWIGRYDDAVVEARKAVALDSTSVSYSTELGRALFFAKRYGDALAELARARKLDSTFARIDLSAAEILASRGEFARAIALLQRQARLPGRPPRAQSLLGLVLARAGRTTEAMEILEDLKARARVGGGGAFDVATVYVGLGDHDRAFEWLDKAYDDRSLRPFLMDPSYETIRRDPRFAMLMRRMGLTGVAP